MNCPACLSTTLETLSLEEGFSAFGCPTCGGCWIRAADYRKWQEQHDSNLPEKPASEGLDVPVIENPRPKLCADCGGLLLPYKVGHDVSFSLERCGHCGGVWCEKNEWDILKSRNLHDDLHLIFSAPWQDQVAKQEYRRQHLKLLLDRFGAEDLQTIRDFKAWMDDHPRRREILAMLSQEG